MRTITELAWRLTRGDTVTIAGLGDSLTYGWMVSRGFFDRFVALMSDRFEKSTIKSINAGVPGDTAAGGLSRCDTILASRPDLVTVQFGLNDMYQGVGLEAFKAALTDIATRATAGGALPLLVTSCPLPWEEGRRLSETFYEAIHQVASARGLPVARLDLYWRETAGSEETWRALLQADDVHPTDEGHALMAAGLLSLFEVPEE
jgi:acyl-CoA thioesterase-1